MTIVEPQPTIDDQPRQPENTPLLRQQIRDELWGMERKGGLVAANYWALKKLSQATELLRLGTLETRSVAERHRDPDFRTIAQRAFFYYEWLFERKIDHPEVTLFHNWWHANDSSSRQRAA